LQVKEKIASNMVLANQPVMALQNACKGHPNDELRAEAK
jgi:hypothetical protein